MAAFNNGFPMGYPQYYPQNYVNYTTSYPSAYPQSQQSNQNQNNGMTWVQGLGGAKSYLVAPNATAILWDSEAPVIYLKSADASGMPSMKVLDYTIRDVPQNNVPPTSNQQENTSFATKEDIDALRNELNSCKSRIDALSNNRKERKDYKNE